MTRVLYDLCGIDPELRFSPFCWRVRYALAHKGLAFETRPWNFTDKAALAFAEHDKVPVLVDGNETVTDSFAILRYLDHAYPQSPLLGDSQAEVRVRFFKHYAERALQPAIMRTIIMDLLNAIDPKDRAYFRASREQRLGRTLEEYHSPAKGLSQLDSALAPLRGCFKDAPFVDGESPAGADYLLFGAFMWARVVSTADLVSNADPVYGWIERMLDLYDGMGRNAMRIADIQDAYR